ncbi:MAG: ABC transporter ATP-binding protein [Thermoprotei archaeon]|nr:MAG: ABC transporter ATP-binding protein [Thermoprotei archaeon]
MARGRGSLFLRFVREVTAYRGLMAAVAVSTIVGALAGLAAPYLLGMAIDRYVLRGDIHGLLFAAGLYLAAMVSQWAAFTARSYAIQVLGQRMLYDLRNRLFWKLQRLSLRFYSSRRIGDLVSVTINDTSMLNEVLVAGVLTALGDVVTIVGIVAMMLMLSPPLTGAAMLSVPLILLVVRFFGSRLRRAYRETRERIAQVSAIVEESVAGISVIKAFGREDRFVKTFAEASRETLRAFLRVAKLMGFFWPSIDLSVTVSVVAVLIASGYMSALGAVSIGTVVAFVQYVYRFAQPIMHLANMYDSLQSALAALERIYGVLDEEDVEMDRRGAIELRDVRGEVELRNVTFGYDPSRPVLKNVSLKIRPGETVAIVGRTGAGKTTLTNLLLRFYEPQRGTITIDGIDIRRVKLSSLRRIVSYVPQETYLFPGTIMDNIRLGRPDASDEEVVRVCKELGIHEFIERLPQGYQTDAGEAGKRLSTGEKQLIAIARAMLRNPAIVILDEALSSVDAYTEAVIRRAMRRLMRGRTSILIAHRLSMARESDRIVVIENGEIVEQGSHEELMRRRGYYYRLYTYQARMHEVPA